MAFGLSGAVDDINVGLSGPRHIGDLRNRHRRSRYLVLSGVEERFGVYGGCVGICFRGTMGVHDTRYRFDAGQRTELVVLSEVLELVDGVLVVKVRPTGNWKVNEVATPRYVLREPTVCVVHDNEGRRELTARQYQELFAG